MTSNNGILESKLWAAADQLWANSNLRAAEFSTPVLGLIFLLYADHRFSALEAELKKTVSPSSRRGIEKADYQSRGVMFLPENARFSYLRELPEGSDIGQALVA